MGDAKQANSTPPNDGGEAVINVDNGDDLPDAVPLGSPIKEEDGRKIYKGFEYEGTEFKPLDAVSLNPDEGTPESPYFALIKEVWKREGEELYMTIQWFYRPDEAKKKNGTVYPTRRKNELFYSFHTDEVPAGSVFHKIPLHVIRHTKSSRGLPESDYVVHRVYDHRRKKLRDLEDAEYPDTEKVIIGALIHRAEDAVGDLPDASDEELAISALSEKRPNTSPSKEPAEEEPDKKRRKSDRLDGKPRETAQERRERSFAGGGNSAKEPESDEHRTLAEHGVLTGDKGRDKSLAVFLREIKPMAGAAENGASKEDLGPHIAQLKELERAAFEAKGQDRRSYNALIRHLFFNLRKDGTLRRRFLNGELKASVIVGMDPNELLDGYTAEEKKTNEPMVHDDPEPIEMVDKTCPLCTNRQVGVKDIIAGGKGQIYQLECLKCGHSFTSNEANIFKVTAGPVDPLKHKKDAPSATMKFANVETQMEAQEEFLGEYKEARIEPPGAARLPEEVVEYQGRKAAEEGSAGSMFKESNALKNPADTEKGGPQAGGRHVEAAVLLSGT